MPRARDTSPDSGARRRSRRLAAQASLSTAATSVEASSGIRRNRPANGRRANRQVSPEHDERYLASLADDDSYGDYAATPPISRNDHHPIDNVRYGRGVESRDQVHMPSSPGDTQTPSQPIARVNSQLDEVEECEQGVWGYLIVYGNGSYSRIILKREMPRPTSAQRQLGITDRPRNRITPGRFIIGRRQQETDLCISKPALSNRHCILFLEQGNNGSVILEDLSMNGTFVNDCIVGRNNRRVLRNGDRIDLCSQAFFIFNYPQGFQTSIFDSQYIVYHSLGSGQYGQVNLCVEKSTGKRYAVKLFNVDHTDPQRRSVLRQEIGMLMTLDHPNVLQMKDSFHDHDGIRIVLEYIPGGELFEFIVKKGRLREDEARRLFKQVFDGVKYLHDRDIVHRDLKPENILLYSEDLRLVKIADFGLAKIVGEDSFTTTLCGTPAYVAPEVLERKHGYNRAADIWSLGVILYVSLCGFPPFSDELTSRAFPYTMQDQILQGRYEFPSPYWDPICENASDLVESMLQVNPGERLTIDECLAHPWMAGGINPADSTNGLVEGVRGLRVRRGVSRQRTMLADIAAGMRYPGDASHQQRSTPASTTRRREMRPADPRRPEDFMAIGGYGDPVLFDDDLSSTTEATHDITTAGAIRARDRDFGDSHQRQRPRDRDRQRDRERERERERESRAQDGERRNGHRERHRERDREHYRERDRDFERDPDGDRARAGRRERERGDDRREYRRDGDDRRAREGRR
ncbi:serine/threonine protein kinase [Ceratocystis pirilliformis]|uniref:Serine/threonine protein kinase n=1 Tax=Ceratocystis pirilliformis TaxID=259994 RepID=A0ABR3ZH68_9PEZI